MARLAFLFRALRRARQRVPARIARQRRHAACSLTAARERRSRHCLHTPCSRSTALANVKMGSIPPCRCAVLTPASPARCSAPHAAVASPPCADAYRFARRRSALASRFARSSSSRSASRSRAARLLSSRAASAAASAADRRVRRLRCAARQRHRHWSCVAALASRSYGRAGADSRPPYSPKSWSHNASNK